MGASVRRVTPLPPEKLRISWDPERIPWEDSRAIPRIRKKPAQPRALAALEMALHAHTPGYNVFLSGAPDLGRTYMLCNFLEPLARREKTPPDLIYVNNFEDESHPILLQLPAGYGRKLKECLEKTLLKICESFMALLNTETFLKKRLQKSELFQEEKRNILAALEKLAAEKGFSFETDETDAIAIFPLVDGKRVADEDLARLDSAVRKEWKWRSEAVLRSMAPQIRRLERMEGDYLKGNQEMEKEALKETIGRWLAPAAEKFCRSVHCDDKEDPLYVFFGRIRDDFPERMETFFTREGADQQSGRQEIASFARETILSRYAVNILVDNTGMQGAPVIVEHKPTLSNLLGCIEREMEMGVMVTNFSLIKAGSIHRANGGFLILHALDLLQNPLAWDGLMRTLRSGVAKIEDHDAYEATKIKGLEPEPVPLNVKIILVGDDILYETLLSEDERFAKFFKIIAQMTDNAELSAKNVRDWLIQAARIIDENDLLPFSREALAGLVEYGVGLCEDHKKISLRFPLIREMLIESSSIASMQGLEMVSLDCFREALRQKRFRHDLIEQAYFEDYSRGIIKIRTSGSAVGCVNGLAVTSGSDYEFGLPHQISCAVGVGHDGIVDLEREAELGGPIHTKAIMILKSYLVSQFAGNKPLVLTGSICFEQSYTGIEGDSASGAELVALLSAIANVPVRLSLAFTGALSQSGQIMAVGGVRQKIEGFYKLCCKRGLTGEQGVILPRDNIEHLMLGNEIIQAVRDKTFFIYPVENIREALELLMDMPCGTRRRDGTFPRGTLFEIVDKRLRELAWHAEHGIKKKRQPRKKA